MVTKISDSYHGDKTRWRAYKLLPSVVETCSGWLGEPLYELWLVNKSKLGSPTYNMLTKKWVCLPRGSCRVLAVSRVPHFDGKSMKPGQFRPVSDCWLGKDWPWQEGS